jgi:type III secretory pathway lipoprotein EscJ
MRSLRAFIACCCVSLLVSGCSSSPVADDVSQREANEIVSALDKHRIAAWLVKGRGSKGRYSVVVSSGDFAGAAGVLSSLGLPAEKKPSFQELTGGGGIIPPSREVEALRLDRATAQELEDLFKSRSDIASVNVIVRSHARSRDEKPTATVVARRSTKAVPDLSELREIVRRSVPGIQIEDVFISVSEPLPDELPGAAGSPDLVSFLGFWRVPAESHGGLVGFFAGLMAVTAVIAGLAGYLLGQFNWLNKLSAPGFSKANRGVPMARSVDRGVETSEDEAENVELV